MNGLTESEVVVSPNYGHKRTEVRWVNSLCKRNDIDSQYDGKLRDRIWKSSKPRQRSAKGKRMNKWIVAVIKNYDVSKWAKSGKIDCAHIADRNG